MDDLAIAGTATAQEAMRAHQGLIAAETLATSVTLVDQKSLDGDPQTGDSATVGDGEFIRIRLEPSGA